MRPDSTTLPLIKSAVGAFPTIYDDELLYSIVARFGRLTGYLSATAANLDLFGRAFGHAATVLPSALDEMASRLPTSLGLTGRDLALMHTVLPYHVTFLSEAAAERATNKTCADGGYNVRPIRTVTRPLPRRPKLKFCPECQINMDRKGEERHWQRVHQLVIVVVCPEHACDLLESRVSPEVRDLVLHPADADVCSQDMPSVIPSDTAVDRDALLDLARQARTLLACQYPKGMNRDSGRAYAQLFLDLGYYRKGRLDWEKLLPAAQEAIEGIVPALPGLSSISRDGMGWFAHAMSSNRPDRTDSVLITAMIARRVKAHAPRFWASLDKDTGIPLLPLASIVL